MLQEHLWGCIFVHMCQYICRINSQKWNSRVEGYMCYTFLCKCSTYPPLRLHQYTVPAITQVMAVVSSHSLQEGCIRGFDSCQSEMWEIWCICFLVYLLSLKYLFKCSRSIVTGVCMHVYVLCELSDQVICQFFDCVWPFSKIDLQCLYILIFRELVLCYMWYKCFPRTVAIVFRFFLCVPVFATQFFLCIWVYQFYSFLFLGFSPHTQVFPFLIF